MLTTSPLWDDNKSNLHLQQQLLNFVLGVC
jgi:hypothetical protein